MYFQILAQIRDPETIASGTKVRDRKRLQKAYGKGRWRKRKGVRGGRAAIGRDPPSRTPLVRSFRRWEAGIQDQALRGLEMSPMSNLAARFVICVSNEGYPASLETRKVYQEIPDPEAAKENLIRVIDESGEDYLFPREMFLPVELSGEARDAILRAS